MSRIGVILVTMLAGRARGQSNYNAVQCNVDYTAAYMSFLHGDCQHSQQQGGCAPECQALIETVVRDCRNGTYNDTDPGTGLVSVHSYLQRSIQTLQHLGPDDCDYHAGYSSCGTQCTMAHITGGSDLSDFEQHRCIDVDPESGQSAPEAVFHSCSSECQQKINVLGAECNSCSDPVFNSFLDDAGRKLARCVLSNASACQGSNTTSVDSLLNAACCAGADHQFGNDDDTCAIPGRMPAFCSSGLCASAVHNAALRCPVPFVGNVGDDHKRLGLYLDCGGQLDQLLAAHPTDSSIAQYCSDSPAALPQGRRLLTEDDALARPVDAPLASFKSRPLEHKRPTSKRGLQASSNSGAGGCNPSSPQSGDCTQAYQDVFNSMMPSTDNRSTGVCNVAQNTHGSCSPVCQQKITDMLNRCRDQTFCVTSDGGVSTEMSFNQKAVDGLKMLGPTGCSYQIGYDQCASTCSPVDIKIALNGLDDGDANDCAVFFLGVNFQSWNGCTDSNGNAQEPIHAQRCWNKYLHVTQNCSGCSNPFVEKLLVDMSKAVTADECDRCEDAQTVANHIRQVCCAGADGILGTGDDPCSQHVQCLDPDDLGVTCGPNAGRMPGSPPALCTTTNQPPPGNNGGPCTLRVPTHNTYYRALPAQCITANGTVNAARTRESCEKTGNHYVPPVEAVCSRPCHVSHGSCSRQQCCGHNPDLCETDDSWEEVDANVTYTPHIPAKCGVFGTQPWTGTQDQCERTGNTWQPAVSARCVSEGEDDPVRHPCIGHTEDGQASGCWEPQPGHDVLNRDIEYSAQEMCEYRNAMPSCNGTFQTIQWYNPETCQPSSSGQGGACQAYVTELALSGGKCTSLFLQSPLARRVFADCDGSVSQLTSAGRPCSKEIFFAQLGGDDTSPIIADNPYAQASWGSCFNHTSGEVVTLQSGQSCEMTCKTDYCVAGTQPRCLDGHLAVDQPMYCAPQHISSCTDPPNGNCDPLTTCSDEGTGLFHLKAVKCGPCPPGYYGSGRTSCKDTNECMIRPNGGCAEGTTCTNLPGGYTCSDCPPGRAGDSFRVKGCCAAGTTYKAIGVSGADCIVTFSDRLSLGTGSSFWAGFTITLLILFVGVLPAAAVCCLCSKKQYKQAEGAFERVDVGSIGTGPSIYDSTWAR